MGLSCVSGFILGPILGFLLSYVDVSLGPIRIDTYTCPGYIITLGTIFMITQTNLLFKELPQSERPNRNPPGERDIAKPNICGLFCIYLF